MTSKGSGGRKFTEPVPHHAFSDKNWGVKSAVMNTDGDTDKIRRNLTGPGPSFNWFFGTKIFSRDDLGQKSLVDVGSFFA